MSSASAKGVQIRSPLRIDPCGGVSDIPRIRALTEGTCITNVAVNIIDESAAGRDLTPYIEVFRNGTEHHRVFLNGVELHPMPYFLGELVRCAGQSFALGAGADVMLYSEFPEGTGLGGSAQLCLSIFAAFSAIASGAEARDRMSLIRLAHTFETEKMGITGGFQDYFSAGFGGANLIGNDASHDDLFQGAETSIRLSDEVKHALASNLFIAISDSGSTVSSQSVIDIMLENAAVEPWDGAAHVRQLKEFNLTLRRLLDPGNRFERQGFLHDLGYLMDSSWRQHKALGCGVGTGWMETFEETFAGQYLAVHGLGAAVNSLLVLPRPGVGIRLADEVRAALDAKVFCLVVNDSGLTTEWIERQPP